MRVLNKYRHGIPKDAVYIGRGSKWGNPYVIGRDGDRMMVIAKYRDYILAKPDLLKAIPELIGKDLVCYCAPYPCHGDILLKLVTDLEEVRNNG